jgi:fucose permease
LVADSFDYFRPVELSLMLRDVRPAVLLSYAAFVLVGLNAGASGVLLLAQMGDYGVDRPAIGITFFTGAIGFVLAGLSNGALIGRLGIRMALAVGGGTYVVAGLYLATRPPFAAFVAVPLVSGYATGVLESVLNVYLAALPDATTLLNRLHAFFGVGALLGPLLAAWIVSVASWRAVSLVLAVACVPLVAGFLAACPGRPAAGTAGTAGTAAPSSGMAPGSSGSLLGAALRDPGVLLGAAMLAVYVGTELGVGSWGFGCLVQARGMPRPLAGYAISGYWLGLTAGRFLISPAAGRIGATEVSMMYACLAGVIGTAALAWLSPAAVLASAALVLLGFFLGPVFPTTMAIAPRLTSARLAATAIGVMNAGSMVGGAALPWLAGAIGQSRGIWTLLPFTVTLALLQLAVWRSLAGRIRAPRAVGGLSPE